MVYQWKYLHDLRYHLTHPKLKYLLSMGLILSLGCLVLNSPPSHSVHAASSSFNEQYQQAQQNGEMTGHWGSAPYYVDAQDNMYVGAGQLQGNFFNTLGPSLADQVRTLNFTDNVQAPQDSSFLFSNANDNQDNNTLTAIRGIDKVDMSQVTSAYSIFSRDVALNDLSNVTDWNMSQVQDLSYAFYNVRNLEKLNLHDWTTNHTNNMIHMFDGANYLQNLDVTGINTRNANVSDMFDNDDHLFWLTLGSDFQIKYSSHLSGGTWSSYMGSSPNSLMPMSETEEESLYEPSSGIWQGSWTGDGNMYNGDGTINSNNDASNATYMGNRFDAAGSYTDKHGNMYIGQGQIQDSISQVTNSHLYVPGEDHDSLQQGISNSNLRTVSLTAPTVTSGLSFYDGSEFNWDSVGMFSNSANLTHVYGANNFDSSSASSLNGFFANDPKLQDLDVAKWDVTKQYDIGNMFANDTSLSSLNLSDWDTADNQDDATQTDMFQNDTNLSDLYLGRNTKLKPESHLPDGTWVNADTGAHLSSAQLTDNNSHPGEWYHPSFKRDWQRAQQNGWQTGYWGTAPWYIDNKHKMHVGSGQLQGPLYVTTGIDTAKTINGLSFDEKVQAPQDSSSLLSTSYVSGDSSFLNGIDNLDNVDMSQVIDAKAMFANDTGLYGIDLSHLNTHNVQDMSYMFNDDWSMTGLNADGFDTSHTHDFESMFVNNYRLQNPNIGSWDVSHVTDMDYMFWGDGDLTNLGIVNWHPDNLETMDSMFMNNKHLTTMDLSHWNPTQLRNMHSAFVNDLAIRYMNLSNWRLPHIQNMESTFNGDSNMDHLDLGSADTSNASDMHLLADEDSHLRMLSLGSQTQLKDIGYLPGVEWQNGSQTLPNNQLMDGNSHPGFWQPTQFSDDYQQAQNQGWQTGYWGTAPYYIDDHGYMKVGSGDLNGPLPSIVGYDRAKTLKGLDFTEKVRAPQNSYNLLSTSFTSGDSSFLNGIDNLDNVDMSQVVDAKAMFANDTGLTGLDLSHLDTHNVQDMSFMFNDDWSMTGLNADGFDTSHVNNFKSMFANNYRLQNPNIGSWDVSHVTDMDYMFWGDGDLFNLGIVNWHPNSLENMDSMFLNDYSLHTLDLSHWDPTRIRDLHSTFVNDRSLDGNMDLGNWQTPNLQTTESMLNGANVEHANLASFDTSHNVNMPFMFDNNRDLNSLTLNEKTRLNENDRLAGIEWQNDGQELHTSDLNDGTSHPGDWQQTQFSHNYQTAQQNGWQTGTWGSAYYYIDDQHNMYIGLGHLDSNLANTVGSDQAQNLHSINFTEHVQAPQNSSFLLSTSNWNFNNNSNLTHINGLDKLDTSQATDLDCVFTNDYRLNHLDLSNWDTSHVNTMQFAFYNNQALTDLHISDWDTSQVTNMYSLFSQSSNLDHLDLSRWDTSQVHNMEYVFYHDDELSELNLSGWNTSQHPNRYQMFGNDHELQDINLGSQISLSNDTGLDDGIWQNASTSLTLAEMTNEEPHPGTWFFIPLHHDSDIQGTEYDNLRDLIKQKYQVPNDQVMIVKDDHSLRGLQGNQMNPGDHDNVIFTLQTPNGDNQGFYHVSLHVQAYTSGASLQGHAGQSLRDILEQRYGEQVHLEDTDGSTDDGNSLNTGDYHIRYRYPDAQGNWHYQIAPLHVDYHTTTDLPFLIVNDHPNEEIYDQADIQHQLTAYLGANPDAQLSLSNVHYDTANYTLTSGKNSYNGTLKVIPSLKQNISMENVPDANDTVAWHQILNQSFSSDNGVTLTNPTGNELVDDTDHGKAQMTGMLYPSGYQVVNNPAIPYDLSMTVDSSERSVDNTINDPQVNDVLNAIDPHARIISVVDSQGEDMTPSLHALSTIKNNTDLTIKMQTDQGLITLHLAAVNDLVEPSVDIHDNDNIAGQIQDQTHESDFRDFGIDDTHQLSPSLEEIDYHFTKNVQAKGTNVHVNTNNVTVSGTAYLHSSNDDPTTTTYTVIQGDDPISHIENVIGHQIRITQLPDGQDLKHLAVGSYDLLYQNTDDGIGATQHAKVNVLPDYYFGSMTSDPSFDLNDSARNVFESNDYQHNGNYYRSVVDTDDDSKSQANNSHSDEPSDTVDGLHTQDGKSAHFDSKDPYLK